jgi:phosphate uptake regulator
MSATAALADAYLHGVTQLRNAVQDMTPEQLLARPVPGKWSTLEVVAHIADFETVLSDRILRIVALDRPMLVSADENRYTAVLGYQSRDLQEELALIAAVRTKTARIIRSLPAEALQRVGVHSERGELTLERVITMATNHIPNHLVHVMEKRQALGL